MSIQDRFDRVTGARALEQLCYQPRSHAMFLDFDGTLVDLAHTPDAVVVTSGDAELLRLLLDAHEGSVAIVSGRAIDDLERFLPGFTGDLAGGHGAEFRINGQRSLAPSVRVGELEHIKAEVRSYAATLPKLLVEEKATGIVLHYRAHPECEDDAIVFAQTLAGSSPDFEVQRAKMAVELRPRGISKAAAMDHMLALDGFAGRKPFFAGDDVTDEAAFGWVNDQGGISVRVDDGTTGAQFQTPSPTDFKSWLKRWVETH
ncbi:MAG: trehalose-phosphatase [Pseudomonadota bacterium]